ncbi:hypothetical protein V2J09_017698 [Rumex salicifolius]
MLFKRKDSSAPVKKDKVQNKKGPNFKKQGKPAEKSKAWCYVCGKPGHKAFQCFRRNDIQKNAPKANADQVNLAEGSQNLIAMVTELNFVAASTDWMIDCSATMSFCLILRKRLVLNWSKWGIPQLLRCLEREK